MIIDFNKGNGGGGATYTAGDNIKIQNNKISVTGLTSYDGFVFQVTSLSAEMSSDEAVRFVEWVEENGIDNPVYFALLDTDGTTIKTVYPASYVSLSRGTYIIPVVSGTTIYTHQIYTTTDPYTISLVSSNVKSYSASNLGPITDTYLSGIAQGSVISRRYKPAGETSWHFEPYIKTGLASSIDAYERIALASDVIKVWTGTQAEYDAIETKDNNTVYLITD